MKSNIPKEVRERILTVINIELPYYSSDDNSPVSWEEFLKVFDACNIEQLGIDIRTNREKGDQS